MNLRLKKGTKFSVLDSSMATLIWMELGSLEEMEAIRKTLTKENLSAIELTDDAGKVFGKYENRCVGNGKEGFMNEVKVKATLALSVFFNLLGVLAVPVGSLLLLNIIDYATGFQAAPYRDGKSARPIKSYKSIRGIYKKVTMYLLIIVGWLIDRLVGTSIIYLGINVHFNVFAVTIACWLCFNEVVSILENLEDADAAIPPFLLPLMRRIKKQIDDIGQIQDKEDS